MLEKKHQLYSLNFEYLQLQKELINSSNIKLYNIQTKHNEYMKKLNLQLMGCLLLLPAFSYAQHIKGKVIDKENSEPVAFANILILDNSSRASATGTVTDTDGNFTFISDMEEKAIRVSYMGYQTIETVVTGKSFNTITLLPDTNMLGEIVIKGERKKFKMENGGISMDVANSPLNNIGTANDVLEKLPFVVRKGEEISVLGKGTPLIYINNRLVRDVSELDRLNSNNIKKVTVITNPGSEYDATVSSVIRIEATRPSGEGWGGDVSGKVTARNKISSNFSTNLNYRNNNLDIFAAYGYYDLQARTENTQDRTLNTERQTTRVYRDGVIKYHTYKHFTDGGFNYAFNEQHSIGAKYTYTRIPPSRANYQIPINVYINGNLSEESQNSTINLQNSKSHLVNAYYTGEITSWLKVQADFDYSEGDSENNQTSLSERESEERVSTNSLQDYDLYAGKLTFSIPLWGNEARYGVEFNRTTNEQNYIVNENEGAEDLTSNTKLSKQKLFAAFLNYSKSVNKWKFDLGMRFENVNIDYYENKIQVEEQSRTYQDWFPTASISYKIGKTQMMLGYRSTIKRPSYFSLRNTIQYNDPYSYETGEPYLKPTKTDDISYSLLWNKIKFIASYKMLRDIIVFLPHQYENKDIIIFRPENLKRSQNASADVYYSPKVGIWEPVASIGISKDFLSYGEPIKRSYKKPYWIYSLQNTLHLPCDILFMAEFWGNTRGNSSVGYAYEQFMMNMQLNKTFMHGNLILNLRGTDILNTHKEKFLLEANNCSNLIKKKNDSRSVSISILYKFNSSRSKYKGESISAEERKRL